jgi:hypothetical protein
MSVMKGDRLRLLILVGAFVAVLRNHAETVPEKGAPGA